MQTQPIIIKSPAWLPPAMLKDLKEEGRLEFRGRFTRAEKKVLKKRKRVPVSQWVERHRVLTLSALPGPWRNHVTPYLIDIMDASFFPSVQTIVMCAAQQTGKSESVHNCIAYAIDRAPGPTLYVYPDEKTARENSQGRIQPMITSSPRLASYMTGVKDDTTTVQIKLNHMPIYLGWARSAASLANKPIRYMVFDEIDLYPAAPNKDQPDSISYGEKRTRTFRWSRKIWKISSPTVETGAVWLAYSNEAQVRFEYAVCCPYCGDYRAMIFEHIKWPKEERDPEEVESQGLAWYECPACRVHWSDDDRNRAVRNGRWQDKEKKTPIMDYLTRYRPKKIAFQVPAWLSYFVSLSECAAAFLKAHKNKTKLKDFLNAYAAEPWREYTEVRTEDAILKLRDHRPRGLVPSEKPIAGLLASADTQDTGFYFEIRAWGYGLTPDTWQVREGFVLSFEDLERVFFQDQYKDSEGKQYLVQFAVIDAMGHRTKEVYDWTRNFRRRVMPLQGVDRLAQPVTYSKIDTYPGTNKQIPGGLMLMRVNVTYFKDNLNTLLEIAPGDPGCWNLHSETTVDWCRQMVSEYPDERKGIWVTKPGREGENHAWDVSVYQMAAAEACGIRHWKETKPKSAREEKRTQPITESGTWLSSQQTAWLSR